MSIQDAEDLITRGHELWKAGHIGEAFACQHASLQIKRRIEREWDYKIALTSDGLRVQQERDMVECNRKYEEAYEAAKTKYMEERHNG